jgi:hypothetical protein
VPLEECEALWAANQSIDHHHVCLGWYLNRARVSVPPSPPAGLKLDAEIRRRIRNLPEALRLDRKYRNRQFWYDFLAWEHTARRRNTHHHDYGPWESYDVIEFLPTRMTRTTTSSRRRTTWPWRTPPHHRAPGICPGVPGGLSSWVR